MQEDGEYAGTFVRFSTVERDLLVAVVRAAQQVAVPTFGKYHAELAEAVAPLLKEEEA